MFFFFFFLQDLQTRVKHQNFGDANDEEMGNGAVAKCFRFRHDRAFISLLNPCCRDPCVLQSKHSSGHTHVRSVNVVWTTSITTTLPVHMGSRRCPFFCVVQIKFPGAREDNILIRRRWLWSVVTMCSWSWTVASCMRDTGR